MSGGLPAYRLPVNEVLQQHNVSQAAGLADAAVRRRRAQHGLNSIPQQTNSLVVRIVGDRLRDITVLLLLAAGVISFIIGHPADAAIIGIVLFVDTVVTYAQVWRTERTLERLRRHVEQEARVRRNGRLVTLPAKQLVAGDIIEFRAGNKIPADARLVTAAGLAVSETALTGESTDVTKQLNKLGKRATLANRSNMVFMGTTVMSGTGTAVVTATGTRTAIGQVAQLLKEQRAPETPLRRQLKASSLRIALGTLVVVVLMVLGALFAGTPFPQAARTAITLIVSVIPEDLPIIMTIALTVGVVRILRKQGVVRVLSSAETLGATSVICTDKTGTLTLGTMTAVELDFLQGDSLRPGQRLKEPLHELALTSLALASDAHRTAPKIAEYYGSATERASLAFAESFGLVQRELLQSWRERDSIPFSTEWKYRASLRDHPTQGTQVLLVNGAPDVLLEKASHHLNETGEPVPLTSADRAALEQQFVAHAAEGKRLLACAASRHLTADQIGHDDVTDLLLLGVVLITDPVRPDVRQVMQEAQAAGLAVKLVTGDHAATATSVARQVGLTVPDGALLDGDAIANLSDDELASVMQETIIFARVTPIDKQRIIRALQGQGEVVAMTGDGVNDAVALKAADIGVAMGSGKDIAKDASDLILLDNNFKTIVAAIYEGRVIRDNIRKVIAFLLSTNAAEIGIFIASLATGMPLPLLPAQVLWINVVTDGTSDIALSLEPGEDDVMARKPEDPKKPLLTRALLSHVVVSGLLFTIVALGLYWYLYQSMGRELEYVRTMLFSFLSLASLLSTWSFASLSKLVSPATLRRNGWLLVSGIFSVLLQLLAVYSPGLQTFFGTVPLLAADWLLIGVLAFVAVVLVDLRKLLLKADVAHG